jgi:hypothetical protein
MTSAQLVRNVLSDEYQDVIVEDLADGSTVVRDARAQPKAAGGFPVSDTLYRCADVLADSGFVIVLVRDKDGVYLSAH